MANDFLSSLFAQKQPQVENSPLMTEEERRLREEEEELRKEDPMAFEPAVEEEISEPVTPRTPAKLASDADVEKMKKFPISPAEQRLEDEMAEAQVPDERSSDQMLEEMVGQQPQSTPNKYQEILEAYRSLKPKQEAYQDQLRNIGILQGANQIAQGMARGFGAEIGSGEAGINALKAQAEEPLNAIKRQMATGKEAMGVEDEISMMDPESDVSKFYREQAYAVLKKLRPESDYTGKLEGMSASQLQKLPGMKNLGSTLGASPWIATDRVDEQGNPIRFNKMTGEYSTADGRTIKPGDYSARDILRRDPLTGQYAIGSAGTGMKVLPTKYEGVDLKGPSEEASKPREITYGEFARNAPEQAKQFNKIRDDFTKDMKDSREVATSVTNLASKLKPGPDNKVDSGLLGGIQTQAAKMAGQKGVLTDQDLVKFAGAGGVAAKIERIVDGSLFGEMTDTDVKFFKRFAQLMGKSLNEDIINRSQLYVEQGRQLVDTTVPGVTSDNISKMLGVDKVAPIVQQVKQTAKPKAGSIVNIKGKQYKIAEDGDTLIPINK